MADDPNNDEYTFAELDELDSNLIGEDEPGVTRAVSTEPESPKKDIRRNALIAVGIILTLMLLYKLLGSMFFTDQSDSVPIKPSIPSITPVASQPIQPVAISEPIPQIQPVQPIINNPNLEQKVSNLESSQESIKSEVSVLSQQVTAVSNNINNLNTQMASLNQIITNLSNQVEKQSEQISTLLARTQPRRIKAVAPQIRTQRLIFYIQAVIPGRAWLISSNGSTLTVREGTKIPGYGVVKLIDSMQGRVITSSGQIIRFSQEDS